MRVYAALLAIFVGGVAQAADLTSRVTKDGKAVITLSGEIAPGDTDRLKLLITQANNDGKIVSGIRLQSPGGNLIEGVKLSEAVRFAKIATVVTNGSTCASACFIVFASGSEKYASFSAQVGVHGASTKSGEPAGDATVAMAKIIKDLGVPASIIGKMVVTAPDQVVWLDPNDLRSLGTTMTGRPSQVAVNPIQTPTTPITPQVQASTPVADVWDALVRNAVETSSAQNGGTANVIRSCQPELRSCVTGVLFKYKSVDMLVRRTEDLNGKTLSRDVCSFNTYGDVRDCVDFDTKMNTRSVKNIRGEWIATN